MRYLEYNYFCNYHIKWFLSWCGLRWVRSRLSLAGKKGNTFETIHVSKNIFCSDYYSEEYNWLDVIHCVATSSAMKMVVVSRKFGGIYIRLPWLSAIKHILDRDLLCDLVCFIWFQTMCLYYAAHFIISLETIISLYAV